MYVPPAFEQSDLAACHGLIQANGFAILVTSSAEATAPMATHLPFLLDRTRGPKGTLIGHMARANPHRELLGAEALVIFQGPHAYVSPSWYEDAPAVPTWNYIAVHAHGRPEIIDDPADVRAVLARLVGVQEAGRSPPWQLDSLPGDFIDGMVRGIVAFKIPIARLDGKWKLSQNRSAADREGVIRALHAQGDPMAQAVADELAAAMEGG